MVWSGGEGGKTLNEVVKVFLSVVEHANFTRAATELHLTQPAVSQHIRGLERDLGAQLIERNNRMIRLTRAGEIVLEHARRMVQTEEQMRRLVDDLANRIGGPLRIGASYSIGEYMLPAMLAEFCLDYPGVMPHIEIANTQTISSLVARRELDVGLVEGSFSPTDVETEVLGEDEMVLVGSAVHPLTQCSSVAIADVEAECWILREEGSGTREVSDHLLQTERITPIRTMVFSSTQAIKEAVKAGLGITLLSVWTVQTELKLGVLKQIPLGSLPITRRLFIVTQPAEVQPKVVSSFASFASRHFHELKVQQNSDSG